MNDKCLKIEVEFKDSINDIKNTLNEIVVRDLRKKDEYIHTYQTAVTFYDNSESYHKEIICLYQERASRL